MPVKVKKIDDKYRIVEEDGSVARTKGGSGKPHDGGGHRSRTKAEAQARAINQGLREAGKI
jgi:hypothetical protein